MKAPASERKRWLSAAAGAGALALFGGALGYGYVSLSSQPLRRVVFAGDLQRIPAADLEALARSVESSAGETSLADLREAARRIPWVREAAVRRRFPDAAEVTFETHEALARWNDRTLVSRRGELFSADYVGKLPRFQGPEASVPAMAREYPAIAHALEPVASPVAELRLSARGAWQAVLDSGLVLELGRGDFLPRLERFAAAWTQVAAHEPEVRHADLRYANGFALRLAPEAPALSNANAKAARKGSRK